MSEKLKEREEECDLLSIICKKQADSLTRIANAVRGQPPEGTQWAHHDLAERVEVGIRRLEDALRQYAAPNNWGYYEGSGSRKGIGEAAEECFIGPDVARIVLEGD